MRDREDVQRASARASRALVAAMLLMGAYLASQVNLAIRGSFGPEITLLLLAATAGLMVGGVGCLISVAFIGIQREPVAGAPPRDECHCMNCMNRHAREEARRG